MNVDPDTSVRSTAISHHLEELILDGTLQPGDKIPSERQLCQRLSASRPSIREALKELRGRGVIATEHGKGSFVIGMLDDRHNANPLTRLYEKHPRLLYDLLEVRELLEGEASSLAAERGTTKDLYKITKAYQAMNQSPENKKDLLDTARLDHAFHRSIYEASHNPVLVHTLQSLMQLMLNSVVDSITSLYYLDRQKKQIDRHHLNIYNAIMNREPEKAKAMAIEHIHSIRDRMLEIEREEERSQRANRWHKDNQT